MIEKDMWLATKRKPCLLMIFLNKLQMSLKTLLKVLKPFKKRLAKTRMQRRMRNIKDLTFQRREEADWTHRKPYQIPAVKKKSVYLRLSLISSGGH